MSQPVIVSRADLERYLAGDVIECVLCGRRLRALGRHLRVAHATDPGSYRTLIGLPAGTPLAGQRTRAFLSDTARALHKAKILSAAHARQASEAARTAGRGDRVAWERAEHSARTATDRPGDARLIAPGAARADGRDAERARLYQQAHRAAARGDDEPMRRYRERYGSAPIEQE